MHLYETIAVNHSHASENRIHDDDVAQRYGFRGALVPGVAVFGYMTHPMVATHGTDWLGDSVVSTRFFKPAYDGDRLSIRMEPRADGLDVTCSNASNELLAELRCSVPAEPSAPDARWRVPGAATRAPRVEIASEAIELDTPFSAIHWVPTGAENRTYTERVADDLEVYATGVVHPHLILHYSNQALVNRFVMPTWIHTGSELRFRRLLRVGDEIEVRAIPTEKWVRKGHEFVKLQLAYVVEGAPAVEVTHTAIYKVAPRSA